MPNYENVLTKDCRGCMYLSLSVGSCDYILIEDKRRPCPGGKGCTVRKDGMRTNIEETYKKPKWDTEKGKALWRNGKTDEEIAKALGVTQSTIASYRLKHWGKSNAKAPGRATVWDKAKGKELWQNGATDAEIAQAVGVSKMTVKEYRRKFWGMANVEDVPLEWDTAEGFRLYQQGMKDKEIAERLGTSVSAVGNYRRRHWREKE